MATKPQAYLAGAMTGKKDYNFEEFEKYRLKLDALGWHTLTPFDASNRVWQKHYGKWFVPQSDKCDYGDEKLKEMFIEDIKILLSSKVVFVLPNSEKSLGVAIEQSIAEAFGIPTFLAEDYIAAV